VAIEEAVAKDKNLVVICVITHAQQSISEGDLLSFAAEHLASYKVPKKIYFMKQFPRTANGKIVRKQLRASLI